jgi:ATPase family associated with various cellular activities (AAA).
MLNKLIGQNDVKDQILRLVASFKLANALNEKYGTDTSIYKHMAFAGPPGTGKTQIARITARLFHEHGLSNGIFLEVGRNDLVAGYLGQTAMKVSKIFEKAKGGVIFIDEAGSLVLNSQDNYTKEAITTLIRFMENNPDTTVILATYPDEMERLLDSDRGFRSRIAKVIEFLPYTDDELWEIFKLMAADRHHTVEDAAKGIVLGYIEALKKAKKKNSETPGK